jgi:hypothetical protein
MNRTARATINIIGISGFILWLLQFLWGIQTHQNGEIHDPVLQVPVTYENKSTLLTDGYMGFVKRDSWFSKPKYYLYICPTKFDSNSRVEWHEEAALTKIIVEGKPFVVMALMDVKVRE